ncbi:MAG: RICIN domain-containing protein, partial [Paludibacteraceae bacterium]|nr:RICIN domain-containing protein [Paludibacteraceae bacterium]
PWNTISSLRLPKGFKATLYTGNNLGGTSASYGQDSPYVGDNMNDKTNSIRVEPDGVRGLDGTYKIVGRNSGQFWDMDGNGTGNGTHLVQWTDEGDERYQHWVLTEVEKGVYKIHNVGSPSKVAEVKGGSKENRAELQIYDDNGGYHQQFIAYQPEAGWYQWVVRNSGKIVELPDNSLSAGTQLKLWDNNGQTCSHWQLYNDHYTSLDETAGAAGAVLYPSPADEWLCVELDGEGSHTVVLCNLQGQVLATQSTAEPLLRLPVGAYAPGMYIALIDGVCHKWIKR